MLIQNILSTQNAIIILFFVENIIPIFILLFAHFLNIHLLVKQNIPQPLLSRLFHELQKNQKYIYFIELLLMLDLVNRLAKDLFVFIQLYRRTAFRRNYKWLSLNSSQSFLSSFYFWKHYFIFRFFCRTLFHHPDFKLHIILMQYVFLAYVRYLIIKMV